jgi:HSP20 family molecular chaperone IbpA
MVKKDLANISIDSEEMIDASSDQQNLETDDNSPKNLIQYRVIPDHYLNVDSRNGEWQIEINIPGVKKELISLRILPELYDLQAKRSDTHIYSLTEYLPFEVRPETIQANYDNGLLIIKGNIKNPLEEAIDIPIQ